MIIGVFSVRRKPDLDMKAYEALNDRMWAIVSGHREFGLIGVTGYRSEDGRSLAMAFFENREGMLQWKQEIEHAAAQQNGRDDFFLDYWGFVAEMTDAYEFDAATGRRQIPLDSRWRPDGFEGPGT
jgi:heme-degrading monooxygenase HmoA